MSADVNWSELLASRDLTSAEAFGEVADLLSTLLVDGRDVSDLSWRPGTEHVIATVTTRAAIETPPATQLIHINLSSGETEAVGAAAHGNRAGQWSPDGATLAFLSDRSNSGSFQIYVSRDACREAPLAAVDGTVEQFSWTADGDHVAALVADLAADVSTPEGAVPRDSTPRLEVLAGGRRRLVVMGADGGDAREVPIAENVWEFSSLRDEYAFALVSAAATESAWYDAYIAKVDLTTGYSERAYSPAHGRQVAELTSSPAGTMAAFVEAAASDRKLVAGELRVLRDDGHVQHFDSLGVDVTSTAWLSDEQLLTIGHDSLDTVVCHVDVARGVSREIFRTRETSGALLPRICGVPGRGGVVALEAYDRPPRVRLVGLDGRVRDFGAPGARVPTAVFGASRAFSWAASDGTRLDGWIVEPASPPPHPLVVEVHGGPAHCHRNRWAARQRVAPILTALGYAVFQPNPRGSSGRGTAFAEAARGDMGGVDATDILAGTHQLVAEGVADSARLYLTGISYGGTMTAWLTTVTSVFAAAVSCAPTSDWVSMHGTTNIARFDELYLGGELQTHLSEFLSHSAVLRAETVTTPIMMVAGGRDRCTPPDQAREFFAAVAQHTATPTTLVRYPQEGHGPREGPAVVDYLVRMSLWFRHFSKEAADAVAV